MSITRSPKLVNGLWVADYGYEIRVDGLAHPVSVALTKPDPAAPVAAAGAAGNVNVGTHSWKITFVHQFGESLPGTKSNVLDVVAAAKKVNLTGIPLGPAGTKSRKVYRTVLGDGGNHKLVGTISDNTTTTFEDNVADASLGADAPTTDTFPFVVIDAMDLKDYLLDHRIFTLKNTGAQALGGVKIQVSNVDSPAETDWETLAATGDDVFDALAVAAVLSKHYGSTHVYRWWRIIAACGAGGNGQVDSNVVVVKD